MQEFIEDIVGFVRERRQYVLIPLILALLIFGSLVVLVGSSPVAPFIYAIF